MLRYTVGDKPPSTWDVFHAADGVVCAVSSATGLNVILSRMDRPLLCWFSTRARPVTRRLSSLSSGPLRQMPQRLQPEKGVDLRRSAPLGAQQ